MAIKVAVTGAGGQLAQCLHLHRDKLPGAEFVFFERTDMDLTAYAEVEKRLSETDFDYCVNCAAYTAVEKAEDEAEKAFAVNAKGVENLAKICRATETALIHISTDYVFDGKKESPYLENDATAPLNVYGRSKLKGEEHIRQILDQYFILRTSWVYSQFGHNFYKTMKKLLGQNRRDLKVTTEQLGTPTNANDIARLILKLIETKSDNYGLYHFTNAGSGTWFDFVTEIYHNLDNQNITQPQSTAHFATKAARPQNSVLSTDKIEENLNVELTDWKSSLKNLQNSTG